jgi:hypothetical protein
MRHFHEKLSAEHGIELSYTFVQKALQGAGLVARGRKRRKHRRRRERRPMPGMLLHIDGSKPQWFGDERWYDLIVILDNATSETYYAQLVEEKSTRTVMEGLPTSDPRFYLRLPPLFFGGEAAQVRPMLKHQTRLDDSVARLLPKGFRGFRRLSKSLVGHPTPFARVPFGRRLLRGFVRRSSRSRCTGRS